MGAFASALQGIGGVGEDVATGKQTLDQWRQQQAMNQLNLAASKMKLADLQNKIKQSVVPQYLGTTKGPTGADLAIQLDPNTGAITTKEIVPGYDPTKIQAQADQLIGALPEKLQPIGKGLYSLFANSGDPMGGVKALGTLSANIAEKLGAAPSPVNYKVDALGRVSEITDASKVTWMPDDPNLPPDLKTIVSNVNADASKRHEQNVADEARKNVEAINRAIELGDIHEVQKQRDALFKTAQRGIAGHSFFKTIQAQVENAERTGGEGTTAGDMLIVESYMQLMFGTDPKALRGSPKMMETMMKQGGVDDRIIGGYNSLISGGKLSQDVRQEMLDKAKDQLQSWDSAVNMTGQLTDDAKSKALVDRYLRTIGGDAFTNAPAVPPPPVPGATVTRTQ